MPTWKTKPPPREGELAAAKVKQVQAGTELDGQRWEQYKRKVRREAAERAEQRRTSAWT